jgi:hypothetical protein
MKTALKKVPETIHLTLILNLSYEWMAFNKTTSALFQCEHVTAAARKVKKGESVLNEYKQKYPVNASGVNAWIRALGNKTWGGGRRCEGTATARGKPG